MYGQSADGSGTAERLTISPGVQQPLSISTDGAQVVVREGSPAIGRLALLLLHIDVSGRGAAQPPRIEPLVVQRPFFEDNGVISPDGRWLAYESNESSQMQIYVQPFPLVNGGRRQVSNQGGRWPLWTRNGRELIYVDRDGSLTTVPVQTGSTTFAFGNPTKLLDTALLKGDGRPYDVSPDGQRFLLIKKVPATDPPATPAQAPIVVVLNWVEELEARLLAK